jgi:ABC-2 type transport system permease protein
MAGLKRAETAGGGGVLGALARRQYAALAMVRWRMFRNSLRFGRGAVELGARTFGLFFVFAVGVLGALASGTGAYAIASRGAWNGLTLLLWVLLGLWLILPVTAASQQEGFSLEALLRFPVSFGSFFLLHLVFGLVDSSTILGGLCCVGIWAGISAARPALLAWAALAVFVFAAFNILLVRTILAWIERWLAQRRTREIVSALFFVLLLGLQLLNPALHRNWQSKTTGPAPRAVVPQRSAVASAAQAWSPPGLTALALKRAAEARPIPALAFIAALALYPIAAGSMLALRLRAEHRGENLGEGRQQKKQAQREGGWRLDGSGPIAAVMEKELHTLIRSVPLLYGLASPLVMVFVFGGIFRNGAAWRPSFPVGLVLCLNLAMVSFVPLIYNSLGSEGTGIQMYFLSPTPIGTAFLAKNLFHSLVFGLDAALVVALAGWRFGWPDAVVLAATVAWLPFALLIHLSLGTILSISMPHRVNLSRIGRQSGSQASALLSLAAQLIMLLFGVAVFAVCKLQGMPWLAVPVLLAMAAAAALLWRRVLGNADNMANQRRDSLIATLAKVE